MKILTKEQEAEHYRQTLIGGTIGGGAGLAVGIVGVLAAQRRSHFFRSLTPALKAFLVTSSATFTGIVSADHYSRQYEASQNPKEMEYRKHMAEQAEKESEGKTFTQRAMDFGRKERYKIVGGSWIASMIVAFALVNRNKFLTGQQKIVQARVYAQFLTVGVLIATAAFEIADQRQGTGRYETVKYIDPKDPEHKVLEKRVEGGRTSQGTGNDAMDNQWKEMIQEEEERLKAQEERHKQYEREHHKKQKSSKSSKKQEGGSKEEKKDDSDDEGEKEDEAKDKGEKNEKAEDKKGKKDKK